MDATTQRIASMRQTLEQSVGILRNALWAVVFRGQSLQKLEHKSEKLQAFSLDFKNRADQLLAEQNKFKLKLKLYLAGYCVFVLVSVTVTVYVVWTNGYRSVGDPEKEPAPGAGPDS